MIQVAGSVSGFANRRRLTTRLTLGILAAGLIWRFARLVAGYPIWYDEAFVALTVMVRDVPGLFRPLEFFQVAPIGFLLLSKGVIEVCGAGALALRSVPFLAGAASMFLFARFAQRCLDRTAALLAVGIFAASYYPARHGAEFKPYAIDLLLALLAMDLSWKLWLDPGSLKRWAWLTALVVVGVWFSYPLVFVAAGVGLVLLIRVVGTRDRSMVLAWLALAGASAASWLAMYLLVGRSQAAETSFYVRSITWKGAFPPWDRPWSIPAWLLDVHTGNMLAYPNGGNNYGSTLSAILVGVACYVLRRRRKALAFLLLSPLLPMFLASAVHRYPYGTSARTTLFMAPSFCLLTGLGTATALRKFFPGRRKLPAAAFCTVALGVAIAVTTVGNLVAPYREVADVVNRQVVRDLLALARPGDLWIGYDGVRPFPKRDDVMVEHWVSQVAEIRYHMLAQVEVPVRWMPERIENLPSAGRTWLIVNRSSYMAFDEVRLQEMRLELDKKLGPPILHHFQLSPRMSVDAFEYQDR